MTEMRLYYFAFLLLGAAILTASCSQKARENQTSKLESLKPEAAHESGNPATAASNEGLTFTPPPGWLAESPSSSNRKAQFKLPRAEGDSEDAELVVHHFPSGGGTPQANIDRWIGQFAKPDGSSVADTAKVTHRSIDGIPLTIVDVSGSYSNSMMSMQKPEGPKASYRMFGAIAETKTGPWFIRLTGPAKTVSKWAPTYEAFLNSIRYR
jgi:hypothetical protein